MSFLVGGGDSVKTVGMRGDGLGGSRRMGECWGVTGERTTQGHILFDVAGSHRKGARITPISVDGKNQRNIKMGNEPL
jgi:hypothetical protein